MRLFLFPGQGSQALKMGLDFYEKDDDSNAIFHTADSIIGDSFLDILFGEDASILNNTRVAQPALLTAEVAIAHYLVRKGIQASGCAGHSLGEITALVVSGAVRFEDALVFTKERARLMSENIPEGGMAAVMGLAPEAIEAALPIGAQIANFNSPDQTIISGSKAGLEAAAIALKEAGAKRVLPLKVSGPFHSEFMRPAAEAFAKFIAEVTFTAPKTPFISSVTGGLLSDPEAIRATLAAQLYSPVRWIDVMGATHAIQALEIGPGKVLAGLAKRIDGAPEVTNIATLEDADAL